MTKFIVDLWRWQVAVELFNAGMQSKVSGAAVCVENDGREVLVLDMLVWMWLVSLA